MSCLVVKTPRSCTRSPREFNLNITGMRSWVEFDSGKLTHAHVDRSGRFFKAVKNVKRVTRLKWTIINCFLPFNFVTSSLFNSITMKLYFLRHGQADWASWKNLMTNA